MPTSVLWSAATPTCRSSASPTAGSQSTPAAPACRTDEPEHTGPSPGPGVELRTTHFDLQAAATRLSQDSSYPDITEWADYYLYARATDAGALTAFAPRDGRDHSP
ncbi:hypothetical protein GCM10020254_81470 [Streptomyces goshikiensis]